MRRTARQRQATSPVVSTTEPASTHQGESPVTAHSSRLSPIGSITTRTSSVTRVDDGAGLLAQSCHSSTPKGSDTAAKCTPISGRSAAPPGTISTIEDIAATPRPRRSGSCAAGAARGCGSSPRRGACREPAAARPAHDACGAARRPPPIPGADERAHQAEAHARQRPCRNCAPRSHPSQSRMITPASSRAPYMMATMPPSAVQCSPRITLSSARAGDAGRRRLGGAQQVLPPDRQTPVEEAAEAIAHAARHRHRARAVGIGQALAHAAIRLPGADMRRTAFLEHAPHQRAHRQHQHRRHRQRLMRMPVGQRAQQHAPGPGVLDLRIEQRRHDPDEEPQHRPAQRHREDQHHQPEDRHPAPDVAVQRRHQQPAQRGHRDEQAHRGLAQLTHMRGHQPRRQRMVLPGQPAGQHPPGELQRDRRRDAKGAVSAAVDERIDPTPPMASGGSASHQIPRSERPSARRMAPWPLTPGMERGPPCACIAALIASTPGTGPPDSSARNARSRRSPASSLPGSAPASAAGRRTRAGARPGPRSPRPRRPAPVRRQRAGGLPPTARPAAPAARGGPWLRKARLKATRSRSDRMCVENTTVVPRSSTWSTSSRRKSRRPAGSRLATGSSSTSRSGSCASARTMDRRCCCPCDNAAIRRSRGSPSATSGHRPSRHSNADRSCGSSAAGRRP
ncbi:hypothetical protein Ddc_20332 [Ditylenchus destructor]|nr:hypothetical protein Ddc_20332 [Ditylenchus destructor]